MDTVKPQFSINNNRRRSEGEEQARMKANCMDRTSGNEQPEACILHGRWRGYGVIRRCQPPPWAMAYMMIIEHGYEIG